MGGIQRFLVAILSILVGGAPLSCSPGCSDSLAIQLPADSTAVDRADFTVSAEIVISDVGRKALTDVQCFFWQSPNGAGTGWGAGLLQQATLGSGAHIRKQQTFVRGQMHFDRIFLDAYDSQLRVSCRYHIGRTMCSTDAVYRLVPATGRYMPDDAPQS